MNRRQMASAVVAGSVAGAVAVPAVLMAVRSFAGEVSPGSVIAGSVAATAFLAVSGLVTVVAWEGRELRSLLIRSYVVKVLMLAALGLILTGSNINVGAFSIAIVASAFAFLAVQTVLVTRNR